MGAIASVANPFTLPQGALSAGRNLASRTKMPPVIVFPGSRDAEDAAAADEAGKRQRKRAAGAGGRALTILTSPLGLPADAVTGTSQAKTLLGL